VKRSTRLNFWLRVTLNLWPTTGRCSTTTSKTYTFPREGSYSLFLTPKNILEPIKFTPAKLFQLLLFEAPANLRIFVLLSPFFSVSSSLTLLQLLTAWESLEWKHVAVFIDALLTAVSSSGRSSPLASKVGAGLFALRDHCDHEDTVSLVSFFTEEVRLPLFSVFKFIFQMQKGFGVSNCVYFH